MKAVPKTEKGRQSLIDGGDLFPRKLTKHAPHTPLVDGSQMVDQREGPFRKAAAAGRERRIQKSFARSASYRHHAHERKTLIADNVRITDHHTRPHAPLFVTDGGVQLHHDNRPAA